MITATAATATSGEGDERRDVRRRDERADGAGAWLTMPAKMMKLMPLPIPRSVMSSPIHIRATEPAVRVAIWVSVSKLARSNPPRITPLALSRARNP